MSDAEIWYGLIALTAVLYFMRWLQSRQKVKVYRISPQSLKKSKEVMVRVLPLVEDETDEPLDPDRLPYEKDAVKSASKILTYYYWRENQPEQMERVKKGFLGLSRFQSDELDFDARERLCAKELGRLQKEYDDYVSKPPFTQKRLD